VPSRTYPSAVPVADGITWVGVTDPDLDDFHGFQLWGNNRGSSYNSYLVQGEKTALVDVVNDEFVPEFLERIAEVVALTDIDYVIVNHVEPDHFGGLLDVLDALPNAELVCSAAAARTIPEFHGVDLKPTIAADGFSVDLGGKTLQFLPTPMVHWPDSMFTYVPESKTLLPNDAFGQHIGIPGKIFADEVGEERVWRAMDLYYANILMALHGPIRTAIQKVTAKGWEIEVLAPSHGVVFRGDWVGKVIAHYQELIAGPDDGSITMVFSSAWHSTEVIAEKVAERLRDRGFEVRLFDLADAPSSQVTQSILRSRALLVGSPTMHNGMLHRTAGFLQYISGLRPRVKFAGVFGSFGWSSGATKQMRAAIEAMGVPMIGTDLQIKFRPTGENDAALDAWVEEIAIEMERE